MEKITNQTFQVIESINPKLVEVAVTFNYEGQVKRHYIFLNKKKGAGNATYIAEAKKQFELDLKNKKVTSLKRRGPVSVKGGSSKLAKGLVIGLSCTTLAFGGLFAWKFIAGGNYHTVTFDVEGGTPGIKSVKVVDGESIKEPDFKPALDGDELMFWSTSEPSAEAEAYDFSKPVNSDLTLHAVYPIGEEIEFDDAKAWLDAHYKGDNVAHIQSSDYSWDYSKSIAESGEFKEFGLPFLVAYLITQKMQTALNIMDETNKPIMPNYNYIRPDGFSYHSYNGEELETYIESCTKGEGPDKCEIKNDKLCVTFGLHESLPTENGEVEIVIQETDIFDQNCLYTSMKFHMDKMEIDYPGSTKAGIPAFKGEINGHVYASHNLSKLSKAYKWDVAHYDETESTRELSKDKYSWDFRGVEDKDLQEAILGLISSAVGEKITELYCEEKIVEYKAPDTVYALSPDGFYDHFDNTYVYGLGEDELSASKKVEVNKEESPLYGFAATAIETLDDKCFIYKDKTVFDHSTSKHKEGEINGWLSCESIYGTK